MLVITKLIALGYTELVNMTFVMRHRIVPVEKGLQLRIDNVVFYLI